MGTTANQEALVRAILDAIIAKSEGDVFEAPLGVSNRHVHLSQKDLEVLFGYGYTLTEAKPLNQPGQYAAKETVVVAGPKGAISKVRVLGPVREDTQVELLRSDAFVLGIELPVRMSGCMDASPQVTLIGPKGAVTINHGVMAAWRHIHMSSEEAAAHSLKDGDVVRLQTAGTRAVTFENVIVRAGSKHALEVHIDVDEANAACLSNGEKVRIIPV